MLTHLSLFTGIGGIDLAAEWAGFKTIGQVEIDEYCNTILEKHWPNIPRWKDVKDVTARSFWEKTQERRPILLTGGFPCQPVSCAGKREGPADDRWLWPEMLRIVRELRPPWVVGENVVGILMEIDNVLADLEHQEYECRAFVIPALAVGAWHQRERVFIVAHAGYNAGSPKSELQPAIPKESPTGSEGSLYPPPPPNTTATGLEGAVPEGDPCPGRQSGEYRPGGWDADCWASEPGMGRVADGTPNRVDRLRCLGNAVVPQQIFPILRAIAEIEGMYKCVH